MYTPMKLTILSATMALLAACAPPPYGSSPNYHTTGGALMGAAAGAAVGHAIEPRGGALTGALGGALIGGAVGNQMDHQNQEMSRIRNDRYYNNGYYGNRYDDRGYYGNRYDDRGYGNRYDYSEPPRSYRRTLAP